MRPSIESCTCRRRSPSRLDPDAPFFLLAIEFSDKYGSFVITECSQTASKTTWDAYIDNMKHQSEDDSGKCHISKACIIALDGGNRWTSDSHPNVSSQESTPTPTGGMALPPLQKLINLCGSPCTVLSAAPAPNQAESAMSRAVWDIGWFRSSRFKRGFSLSIHYKSPLVGMSRCCHLLASYISTNSSFFQAIVPSKEESSFIAKHFFGKNFKPFVESGIIVDGTHYDFLGADDKQYKTLLGVKKGHGSITLHSSKSGKCQDFGEN